MMDWSQLVVPIGYPLAERPSNNGQADVSFLIVE